MNPLAVSAAWALNTLAVIIIAKYMMVWVVSIMPPGPAQAGLAALL